MRCSRLVNRRACSLRICPTLADLPHFTIDQADGGSIDDFIASLHRSGCGVAEHLWRSGQAHRQATSEAIGQIPSTSIASTLASRAARVSLAAREPRYAGLCAATAGPCPSRRGMGQSPWQASWWPSRPVVGSPATRSVSPKRSAPLQKYLPGSRAQYFRRLRIVPTSTQSG